MSMSTIFHANAVSMESLLNFPTTLNVPTKKWHSAFAKIYCSRTLFSLAKIAKVKKGINKVPRSPSYTVINFQQDDESFKIDQTSLAELVKMKDLDELHKFGGIRGVASALETDFDGGICGSDQDTARRHEAFGSNTYKKPPSKSLLYFVVDAFKDLTILILLGCAVLSLAFGIKEDGLKEGWYDGGSIFVAVFFGHCRFSWKQPDYMRKTDKPRLCY